MSALIAALAALMIFTGPAAAHKIGCYENIFTGELSDCKPHKHYKPRRKKAKKNIRKTKKANIKLAHHSKKWRQKYGNEYYGTNTRSVYKGKGIQCGPPVRVVGGLKTGEDSARKNAQEAWMEMVRWDHGGKWADWDNARGVVAKCAQTRQGKTMGDFLHKCEIRAQPCLPSTEAGNER